MPQTRTSRTLTRGILDTGAVYAAPTPWPTPFPAEADLT